MDAGLAEAAELFKVLGNESRLRLLLLIGRESRTVGALAEASGLSQPLVSQHLRTLRNAWSLRSAAAKRWATRSRICTSPTSSRTRSSMSESPPRQSPMPSTPARNRHSKGSKERT
jgi:predicted transcriptional regulator